MDILRYYSSSVEPHKTTTVRLICWKPPSLKVKRIASHKVVLPRATAANTVCCIELLLTCTNLPLLIYIDSFLLKPKPPPSFLTRSSPPPWQPGTSPPHHHITYSLQAKHRSTSAERRAQRSAVGDRISRGSVVSCASSSVIKNLRFRVIFSKCGHTIIL